MNATCCPLPTRTQWVPEGRIVRKIIRKICHQIRKNNGIIRVQYHLHNLHILTYYIQLITYNWLLTVSILLYQETCSLGDSMNCLLYPNEWNWNKVHGWRYRWVNWPTLRKWWFISLYVFLQSCSFNMGIEKQMHHSINNTNHAVATCVDIQPCIAVTWFWSISEYNETWPKWPIVSICFNIQM